MSGSDHSSSNTGENNQHTDFMHYANTMSAMILQQQSKNKDKQQEYESEESSTINIAVATDPEEGKIYNNREDFKKSLKFFAISNHFQFRILKSNKQLYVAKCLDENCRWRIRATRNGKSDKFVVKKFNNSHTCGMEIRLADQRHATTSLVADCVKSKYHNIKTIYKPADIVTEMREEYGINISYLKAWRSREKALHILRGKPDESYAILPSFLYMLKTTNPGSVVELETKSNQSFLYVFMALDASIKGWKYCRPVAVVDGTFLKGTYGGTLLSATTQDAAGKIFPLAFSIVDSENDASWEWFFTKIKETFGCRQEMTIVSDRHESIEKAIRKIYPEAAHGFCMYHLLNNLKNTYKKNSKCIKDSFYQAAKAYTVEEFEYHMNDLDKIDERIRPYLYNIGYHKWARAFSINNRYSTMTSNIVESFNAVIAEARELLITMLLEYLHFLVQDWSYANRNNARSTFTNLAKRPQDMINENYIKSLKLQVILSLAFFN